MTATTSNYQRAPYKNYYLLSDDSTRVEANKRQSVINRILTDDKLEPIVSNALRKLINIKDNENGNFELSTKEKHEKSVKFQDSSNEIGTLFRNDKFMESSDDDEHRITKYDIILSSSIMRFAKNKVIKSISDHLLNEVKLKTSDFIFSKVLDPRVVEYSVYNRIIVDLITPFLDVIGLLIVSIVRNIPVVFTGLIESKRFKLNADHLMSVLGLQFSKADSFEPSKCSFIDYILSMFGLKFSKSTEKEIECNLTTAEYIDLNDLKPFICDICEKRFKSLKQLDGHMKDHRETNYRCSVCSHDFGKKYKDDTESFHALKNVNNDF